MATQRKGSRILYVMWNDSCYLSGQISRSEALSDGIVMQTVGFYVGETDKAITVSQDYIGENKDVRHITTIPKVNIIRKRWLK